GEPPPLASDGAPRSSARQASVTTENTSDQERDRATDGEFTFILPVRGASTDDRGRRRGWGRHHDRRWRVALGLGAPHELPLRVRRDRGGEFDLRAERGKREVVVAVEDAAGPGLHAELQDEHARTSEPHLVSPELIGERELEVFGGGAELAVQEPAHQGRLVAIVVVDDPRSQGTRVETRR